MARPRRFPLIRIGLTVVIGSVFASLFYFYLGVGQSLSDMHGEGVSTQTRDLLTHFMNNFLFAGALPGVLFYIGLAFMILGILRNFWKGSGFEE